jgi:hypothetical protein
MRHSAPALLAAMLAACAALACARATNPHPERQARAVEIRLLAAERDGGSTVFWSIDPREPSERRLLARVQHDLQWGVRAAASPVGRAIAYTWMPPGAVDPDHDATLTILDLDGRTARRLATGLDLRTTPLWTADGAAVAVQRPALGGGGALALITLDGGQWVAAIAAAGHHLQPVAASFEQIAYVDSGPDGAWLRRVARGGNDRAVAKLADGAARGFSLSPDGQALAFLRLLPADGGARYEAATADLQSGDVRPLFPDITRAEDTGVAWLSTGVTAVSAVDGDGSGLLLTSAEAPLERNTSGFDVLIAASPDGRWMAVRAFAGGDPRRPGAEAMQFIGVDGRRVRVPGGLSWIGWTPR